jgi:hypothetical protein
VHTVPTPTPSRGTPVEAADSADSAADASHTFVDDTPTRPEPLVGALPCAPSTADREQEPETEHTQPAEPPTRTARMPRGRRILQALRGQLPYGLVLLTMAIGLLRIVQYHWREGSAWIGGALLVAALLRAVLPPRTAGMVAVRGRAVDVLWCVGLAACIMFIAYTLKA